MSIFDIYSFHPYNFQCAEYLKKQK